MTLPVRLRDVLRSDLPIFFEHQVDPEAVRLAGFASRARDDFDKHWDRLLNNDQLIMQTILYGDAVAGNICSFEIEDEREIGYWVGREYWERGIATAAVGQILEVVTERPLYAHVAKHNAGSIRVLEKNGFVRFGTDPEHARVGDQVIEGVILKLS